MITICAKCRFHLSREPGTPRAKADYNNLCLAIDRETKIDPVSGDVRYVAMNDLGNIYFTDEAHPQCRDINKGKCQHFMEK
jgi:hypothetical protein